MSALSSSRQPLLRAMALLCVLLALASGHPARAADNGQLAFGAPFSDRMVVQRGAPVEIWGTASPRAQVDVAFGEARASAVANDEGRWALTLPAMAATTGLTLAAASGTDRIAVDQVAVGDVFLCSGQSNMEFPMGETALPPPERQVPIDANLRLIKVPLAGARIPQERFAKPVAWRTGKDQSAVFSAVCLLFGREIAREQGVVVGLVNSSYGGTPIESWMDRAAMVYAGGMDERVAMIDAFAADPAAAETLYGSELDRYWTVRQSPWRGRMGFANLYNAMIAPLGPMRFAGVLWYQGENNANGSDTLAGYRSKLEGLMAGWRGHFGTQTPFIIIQLASFGPLAQEPGPDSWADVREAQRLAAEGDPHAALVVTIDVGERLDIHPPLKKPVAQRAAQAARVLVDGQQGRETGPAIRSAAMADGAVMARFANVEKGLFAASWGRPGPFQLCTGAALDDCRYADGEFVEDGIAIAVPAGFEPRVLRYCWARAPICNVFDRSQQPLGPFEIAIGRN